MGGSSSRSYDDDTDSDSSSDSDNGGSGDNFVQANAVARSILKEGNAVKTEDMNSHYSRMLKLWALENTYSRDVIFIDGNGKEIPPHWRRVTAVDAVAAIKEVGDGAFVTVSPGSNTSYLVRFRDTATKNGSSTSSTSTSNSTSSNNKSSVVETQVKVKGGVSLGGIKRLRALHGVASCVQ